MIRTVTFYKSADGNCPVEEFLDSLPGKVVQKIVWVLKLIEDLDPIPSSYLKKLPWTFGNAAFNLDRISIVYFVLFLVILK